MLRIWETASLGNLSPASVVKHNRAEEGLSKAGQGVPSMTGMAGTPLIGQGASQDLIIAFGSSSTCELRATADASAALLATALRSSLTVILKVGGMGPVTHQETDQ